MESPTTINNVWTIFREEIKENGDWKGELKYYKGDLSNIDLEKDSRFKSIPDKRKTVYVGVAKTVKK